MPTSFKGNALPPETPMPTAAELDESSGMRLSDANKQPRDHAIARMNAGSSPVTIKEIDKRSLDYVLRSGFAGGLAGCAAKTCVAPLDRVKILFQASSPSFSKYTGSWFGAFRAMRDINHTDGWLGLFRGHSATLLRIFPYAGIKFLAYEQIRAIVIKDEKQETAWRRLVSGSLAGIASVAVTYPLEVIRVRLAFETRGERRVGLAGICRKIYREEAPRVGSPVLGKVVGQARGIVMESGQTVAKGTAAALESTASSLQNALAPKSGLSNFYRGFSPTLWGMLPYAGMSFLTHDSMGDMLRWEACAKYTVVPGSYTSSGKRPKLKNWAELLSGATAGLVSQTASYPLEVIRRRMQVGGAVGDGHRLGISETARLIWRERGFKGFWVGLGIGYLKVVPMAAVSFWVYETGKGALGI